MNVVERAIGALKVFPLPSAVLFPNAILPLHIFEPRYRAMVRDALASDQLIALADLQPGWESVQGPPALASIGCVGSIVWSEELPDGRFNILLQGLVRVRFLEEQPSLHDYREFRGEILDDPPYTGPEADVLRQELLELAGRMPPQVLDPLLQIATHLEGGALADVVAGALVQDSDRRQVLLEELDVGRRLRTLLEDVGELLLRLGPAQAPGPLN